MCVDKQKKGIRKEKIKRPSDKMMAIHVMLKLKKSLSYSFQPNVRKKKILPYERI